MLKDDRRRNTCPVRRVIREETRHLILLLAILIATILIKTL